MIMRPFHDIVYIFYRYRKDRGHSCRLSSHELPVVFFAPLVCCYAIATASHFATLYTATYQSDAVAELVSHQLADPANCILKEMNQSTQEEIKEVL